MLQIFFDCLSHVRINKEQSPPDYTLNPGWLPADSNLFLLQHPAIQFLLKFTIFNRKVSI